MLKRTIVTLGLVLLASSGAKAMHDSFFTCVAPSGRVYLVEAPEGRCRTGDNATRCQLKDLSLIETRGPAKCVQKGGRPLGLPPHR